MIFRKKFFLCTKLKFKKIDFIKSKKNLEMILEKKKWIIGSFYYLISKNSSVNYWKIHRALHLLHNWKIFEYKWNLYMTNKKLWLLQQKFWTYKDFKLLNIPFEFFPKWKWFLRGWFFKLNNFKKIKIKKKKKKFTFLWKLTARLISFFEKFVLAANNKVFKGFVFEKFSKNLFKLFLNSLKANLFRKKLMFNFFLQYYSLSKFFFENFLLTIINILKFFFSYRKFFFKFKKIFPKIKKIFLMQASFPIKWFFLKLKKKSFKKVECLILLWTKWIFIDFFSWFFFKKIIILTKYYLSKTSSLSIKLFNKQINTENGVSTPSQLFFLNNLKLFNLPKNINSSMFFFFYGFLHYWLLNTIFTCIQLKSLFILKYLLNIISIILNWLNLVVWEQKIFFNQNKIYNFFLIGSEITMWFINLLVKWLNCCSILLKFNQIIEKIETNNIRIVSLDNLKLLSAINFTIRFFSNLYFEKYKTIEKVISLMPFSGFNTNWIFNIIFYTKNFKLWFFRMFRSKKSFFRVQWNLQTLRWLFYFNFLFIWRLQLEIATLLCFFFFFKYK